MADVAELVAERTLREAAERALEGSEGRLRDVARREQDAIVRIARMNDLAWKDMSDTAYATAAKYTWNDATNLFETGLRRAIELAAAADRPADMAMPRVAAIAGAR